MGEVRKPYFSGGKALRRAYSSGSRNARRIYSGSSSRIVRTDLVPPVVFAAIPSGAILPLTVEKGTPHPVELGSIAPGSIQPLSIAKGTPQQVTLGAISSGAINNLGAVIGHSVVLQSIPSGAINSLTVGKEQSLTLQSIPSGNINNLTVELEAGGGGSNGLLTNLLEYWSLSADTGTQAGELGNQNLYPTNNPVWTASGKNGGGLETWPGDFGFYSQFNTLSGTNPKTNDLTLSWWVQVDALNGGDTMLYMSGDTGVDYWEIYLYRLVGWTLELWDEDGNDLSVDLSAAMPDPLGASWYHIVLLLDADGVAQVYVNGSLAGTSSSPALGTLSDPVSLPEIRFGEGVDGTFDEIGIWNRLLSPADITALYNSGSGLYYSSFD